MKNIISDRGVQVSLAAVVPLMIATVVTPGASVIVGGLWVVWAVFTTIAVGSAVRDRGATE